MEEFFKSLTQNKLRVFRLFKYNKLNFELSLKG